MQWKYELICQRLGMTEEEIKAVRKIFDDAKTEMKNDRRSREKAGITFVSMQALKNDDPRSDYLEFPDPRPGVEQQIFHQMFMEYLDECLSEMNEFDKNLLLEFYAGQYGVETAMAEKYGMHRLKFRRYREALEEELKEKFEKKFGKF